MDVLMILLVIVVCVIGLGILAVVAIGAIRFFLLVAFVFWPVILGLPLTIAVWTSGYDNIGACIGIASLIGGFCWFCAAHGYQDKYRDWCAKTFGRWSVDD
jgi:hypothetical protein